MKKISIVIVDDHTLIRESWSYMLNADQRFMVVATCATGEEAITKISQLQPDIVILDINMPGMTGIEAAVMIQQCSPLSKIICISMYTQPAYVRKMNQIGVMGYVTKSSSKDEMITAILEVSTNRKYICTEIKNILAEQQLGGGEKGPGGPESLSARELEIIGFVKKGLSSKEIAEILHISVKTVEVHRYKILKKLKVKNVAALINYINNDNQLAAAC